MKTESILKQKSYAFALKVIETSKYLVHDRGEYILNKQFLRAGTAIGALIREAEFAQSQADFVSKLSIALKESNETDYWISLLKDAAIVNTETANQLEIDNKELIKMLVSSIKTVKSSIK